MNLLGKFLLAGSLFILILVMSLVVEGFVISMLWGWYVVPLGVLPINLLHGVGIALLVSVLTFKYQKYEGFGVLKELGMNAYNSFMCLGLGFLLHSFI